MIVPNKNYFVPKECKFNPNRDEQGRFASGEAFHATSAGEAIRKDGFKIVEGKNGKLLGDAIYLAPSEHEASVWGQEVLKVDTSSLANVKFYPSETAYKKNLLKMGIPNFEPSTIRSFMLGKGHDAVIVAGKTMAVFSPEKLKLK